MNTTTEMTPVELKLMCDFSLNPKRIASGNLYQTEQDWLAQLRQLMDAVAQKYPSYSFEWIRFSPPIGTQTCTRLDFCQPGIRQEFLAELECDPVSGISQARDNFYGFLITGEIETIVRSLLPQAAVSAFIQTTAGPEYREGISFRSMLQRNLPVFPTIHLTVPPEMMTEDLLPACEQLMRHHQVPGFYQISMQYGQEKSIYYGSFTVPFERR